MEKKPLLLRTLIVLIVVGVFCAAMYPLAQRDYYDVFFKLLKNPTDPLAKELVADAKARQEKDPNLFQSQALLSAADERGVNLAPMVNGSDLQGNRDVMSLIRKKASSSIRLGLDLNGGVEFYLELVPDQTQDEEMRANMEQDFKRYRDVAIEQLRKRLEAQGIYEAELAPSGERHIVLRAPVVTNDEKAKLRDLIQMSARLHFRLVEQASDEDLARYKANPASVPFGTEYMEVTDMYKGKPVVRRYLVATRPEMDGRDIKMARSIRDEMGQRKIMLNFNAKGAQDFARVTGDNVHRQLAIVLDGKLYCAPNINEKIGGGSASISGSFTEDEAKSIADALVSGSFPFQIKVSAVFDTDPKLGAASVRNGIWVGIISMILVAVFMLIYYRFSGLIAVVALALNLLLILGAMAAFDCTLTLPGIAGIVLTIGMAVDANVLVYERIREELREGRKLVNAVNAGYDRALTAVVDANITTLITSFILMYVGTGAIKGFAVTLSIGILTNLFTAIFVTRLIYDYLFSYFQLEKISMLQIFTQTKFDLIKFWKYALLFSAVMILTGFVLIGVRGKKVLGIDFTGGTSVTYQYDKKVDAAKITALLAKQGYDEPQVTYKSNIVSGDAASREQIELLFRGENTAKMTGVEVGEQVAKAFPELGLKPKSAVVQQLDGLIGNEFTKSAIIAIALALVGIGIYIVLRYEFTYAMAAVVLQLHDVLVVLGVYLASGRTLSLSTVAAFLTVIGYSINDKVVIFDRIRENVQLHKGMRFDEVANLSVNQTLSRTMITSLTTFIVVFVLLIFGGSAINDFVWVMMLGVILGTYSSVCVSAPLVAYWRRKRSAKEAHDAGIR